MFSILIIFGISIILTIIFRKRFEDFMTICLFNCLILILSICGVAIVSNIIRVETITNIEEVHSINIVKKDNVCNFTTNSNTDILNEIDFKNQSAFGNSELGFSYLHIEIESHDMNSTKWTIDPANYKKLKGCKIYLSETDVKNIFKK